MTFGMRGAPVFELHVALEKKVSHGYPVWRILEADARVFDNLIF